MPLARGDKLGHYEILEPIGNGGMGEVYKARDAQTGGMANLIAPPFCTTGAGPDRSDAEGPFRFHYKRIPVIRRWAGGGAN
jgi:serine/threonine protein kinase